MMMNHAASRLPTPTIASEVTDFSTIASTTSYQSLGTAYPAGSVLAQDNIAGTGWDVAAQSSVPGKAFQIRGIKGNGNGDGDTTSIRFQANDIDYVTFKSHAGGFYFDLGSFAIRNTAAASFTVQALDAGGNPVGAAVPFSIGASPIGSPFTTVSLAGHPDFVGIYGFKVNLTSGTDEPFFDNLIVANIGIPGAPTAPTTTVDTASLHDDTGALDDDFVTKVAAQTIDGTLSAALASGEKVQVSYDGGLSWSDATGYTVGARNWSTSTTLSGSDRFMARVSNADGSSQAFEHDYTLDTAAPSAPPAPDLRDADDTGERNDDDITSATTPTFSGSAEDGAIVTLYDTNGMTVLGTASASGGAWSITSSALGQGTHGLSVTATDLAGNESVLSTALQVTIDASAPTDLALSATGVSTGAAGSGATLATLSASDSTAVTYALATGNGTNDAHNGSFTILGNSLQVGDMPLGAGTYRICLSATDAAGNISYLAQTFMVHDVPGVVSIVRAGGADSGLPADSTAAVYTVTFSEDVTGVDASDFVLTGSGSADGAVALVEGGGGTYTVTVTGLTGDGTLRLDVKDSGTGIQSGAGVAIGGGFTAGETYLLDRTAPDTLAAPALADGDDSGSSDTDNITGVTTPTFGGGAEDGTIITLYDTDGITVLGTDVALGGAWSITSSPLAQGGHDLTVTATDAAGNESQPSQALTVIIDTAAPNDLALSTTSAPVANAAAGATLATLSAGDSTALRYALAAGDGANDAHNGSFAIAGNSLMVGGSALAAGTYRVYLSVTDAAGNVSYLAQTITVQSIPVVTAIERAGDAGSGVPADATSVTYTVTFSEDVTGVDAGDFVLSGSGSAGGAIALVGGSGKTYTVTVTGLVGDGTLRLDLKGSGTSIESGSGGAIGGGFTAGETYLLDHTAPDAPPAPDLLAEDDSGSANNDNITRADMPTFSGSAEDGATITLYDTDGATVLGSCVALGGAWRITSTVLTDGVHDLTIRAVDAAGNASPASPVLALTVDTAAAAPAALALASASDSGAKGDGVTHIATPTITGTAEAYAAITLYDTDGATVLGTASADAAGAWSITARTLDQGGHTLRAAQTDRAGNTSALSAGLALTIDAPPSTPTQPPVQPPSTVIDGVPVQEKPVTLPGGGSGTQLVIPVIAPERDETTGNADVADIPLALSGGDTLLLAQLPAGFGLSAVGGASRPAADSLEQLIAAIRAATPGHAAGDQAHLLGNGADFLGLLAGGTPLLVQTITPAAATAPSGTLTLTGTSSDAQRTALVIDASDLPAGSRLALDAVDFAAIVGSVDVRVGAGSQIVTGDAAGQRITVAADNHGAVFAGGGSDTLVVAQAASAADGGTTLLHGGLGADVAAFGGKLADYLIERHESYLVVAARAQPEQRVLVVNAESLQFADASLAVEYRDAQAAIAGLYRTVFERQADYLGIDFWVTAEKNGFSLGSIALELIASSEAQALGAGAFNGDAGHDVELLYRNIFGRQGDAEGLAFWTHAMAQGASLESVAGAFMQSAEIAVHEIGVADWDFTVG